MVAMPASLFDPDGAPDPTLVADGLPAIPELDDATSEPTPVDADAFRHAFRKLAATVALVTLRDRAGDPRAMTVTSMCGLSVAPPTLLVCIDRAASTHRELLAPTASASTSSPTTRRPSRPGSPGAGPQARAEPAAGARVAVRDAARRGHDRPDRLHDHGDPRGVDPRHRRGPRDRDRRTGRGRLAPPLSRRGVRLLRPDRLPLSLIDAARDGSAPTEPRRRRASGWPVASLDRGDPRRPPPRDRRPLGEDDDRVQPDAQDRRQQDRGEHEIRPERALAELHPDPEAVGGADVLPDDRATTPYVAEIRSPVKNPGRPDGQRTLRNVWPADAPNERISSVASAEVDAKPSRRAIVIGKNVTRTTTRTFGSSPNPNQTTMSGAIATIGTVCEPTRSGSTARRAQPTRSSATATAVAPTIDRLNPATVSMIVGTAWRTAWSRKSHSAAEDLGRRRQDERADARGAGVQLPAGEQRGRRARAAGRPADGGAGSTAARTVTAGSRS